jgi:hypothetical protein
MRRHDGGSGEVVAEALLDVGGDGVLRLPVPAPSPDAVFKLDR